jgi:parallel beta-helix repeat protein
MRRVGMVGFEAGAKSVRSFVGDLGFRTGMQPRPDGRGKSEARKWVVVLAACALIAASSGALLLAGQPERADGGLGARISYTVHAPIMIYGNSGFTPANGVTGGSGTYSNPYIIEGWEINATVEGFGVYVAMTTKYYVVRGVHVYGVGSMGVAMYGAPHGTVEGCLTDNGGVGVGAMEVEDCRIQGNQIAHQEDFGIMLFGCEETEVTGNTISDIGLAGIAGVAVGNSSIASNSCTMTDGAGILLMESGYCSIYDNTVSHNALMGIAANDTWEMTIEGNNVSHNPEYGLVLGNSTGVCVFHNRFVDNGVQAFHDYCVGTTWDDGYPSGGNYWSDYAGVDAMSGPDQDLAGADGIGDTPYSVEGGGADRYPWMTPDMELIPEFGAALVPVLLVICALPIVLGRTRRSRR